MYNTIYLIVKNSISVFINPIFWLIIGILYIQYHKIEKVEYKILGRTKETIIKRVLLSVGTGFLGGLIGSMILALLATPIDINSFKYVFIVSILLALLHPRFLCFAYGGGVVALASAIIGYPKVDVSSILLIVAVLHIIEGLLILIQGSYGRIPVFLERENIIIGGFIMTRFWPVPIILVISQSSGATGGLYLGMAGVVAVLGYGDMAVTSVPQDKSRISALVVILFGLTLLLISILSLNIFLFQLIGALFSIIWHEASIQYRRRKESKGVPIFTSSVDGLKVLDILPGGIGKKVGLRPGYVIFRLNENTIRSKGDISCVLNGSPKIIGIGYYDNERRPIFKDYRNNRNGIKSLDVLIVPDEYSNVIIMEETKGVLLRIIQKIARKKDQKGLKRPF